MASLTPAEVATTGTKSQSKITTSTGTNSPQPEEKKLQEEHENEKKKLENEIKVRDQKIQEIAIEKEKSEKEKENFEQELKKLRENFEQERKKRQEDEKKERENLEKALELSRKLAQETRINEILEKEIIGSLKKARDEKSKIQGSEKKKLDDDGSDLDSPPPLSPIPKVPFRPPDLKGEPPGPPIDKPRLAGAALTHQKSFLGLGEGKLASTMDYLYGIKRPEKEKMYNLLMDDFNLFLAYIMVYLDVAFEIIDSLWHPLDANTNKVIDISIVVIFYFLINENWSNHKKNLRKEETQAMTLDDFYIYALSTLCFMIFSSYFLGQLYNEGGWIQKILLFDDVFMITVLQLLFYSDRAKLVLPAVYLIEITLIYTVYRVNSPSPDRRRLICLNVGHLFSKALLLFFAMFHNTEKMKARFSTERKLRFWNLLCLINLFALMVVDLLFIIFFVDIVKEDYMVIVSNFIIYLHTAYTQELFYCKGVKTYIRSKFLIPVETETGATSSLSSVTGAETGATSSLSSATGASSIN